MGRTLTNNTQIAYTIETSLGVAGTEWFIVEPNAINNFGATITTVARDPISQNRQLRKGTVTDLDSAADYDEDLTLSSFRNFIEGFAFANGVNRDVTQLASTAAVDGGAGVDSFTIAALTSAQADKFEVDTLIWATGFDSTTNNGLFAIATDAVAGNTALEVPTGSLTAETGATARVSFAGHRVAAGDTVTWTWDAGNSEATLASTGIGTALQALGLTLGQLVHIGSVATLGGSIQNAFENAATNDMFGYARVTRFPDADSVMFDKVDSALRFTDATDPTTPVDIVFGEFIRNVPVNDADYLERSFQFEAAFPNLGTGAVGNTDESYQYSIGNYCNTVEFNLPLTDKATVSFGFVGTDTENPTTTRKTGAASASQPTQTGAFNTSADIARLRITNVDESGLTTDFKSITLRFNNNVTPEKVLARLGAAFLNTGNLEVTIETQLLFSNPLVINAIRNNTTLTMDFVIKNDDGVIGMDIPSLTLGGGGREFPVDQSILINTTATAFGDSALNTSIGVSIMPVPLP